MKKGFSLLELIFAIVVIGIIATFAIPKYIQTRNEALASTLQRDLVTATNSIQSYYLINRSIDDISKAVTLNENNWTIDDNKVRISSKSAEDCVSLEVTGDEGDKEISIDLDNSNDICKILEKNGISTTTIELI